MNGIFGQGKSKKRPEIQKTISATCSVRINVTIPQQMGIWSRF